jgi:uncharacterized membrane protein
VADVEIFVDHHLNAAGAIAGIYEDNNRLSHGFVRAPDGTVSMFDPPDSTGIEVFAMNSAGAIVGRYYQASGPPHGFARAADGTIATIDDPRGAQGTYATGINDSNEIAGSFTDSNGQIHGFLLSAHGRFHNFDPKNATSTYAWGTTARALLPAIMTTGVFTDICDCRLAADDESSQAVEIAIFKFPR